MGAAGHIGGVLGRLEVSWGVFQMSWGALEASFDLLGASWGALECVGSVLEASWKHIARKFEFLTDV